jgi:hypothetical protein
VCIRWEEAGLSDETAADPAARVPLDARPFLDLGKSIAKLGKAAYPVVLDLAAQLELGSRYGLTGTRPP